MKVIRRHWICALAFSMSACAGPPRLDIPSPLTVAHIIDRVQCEVLEATSRFPKLRSQDWSVAVNLTLQVEDSVGVTPTVSFVQPLATAGTQFSFGASAALKNARQRIYSESLDIRVAALKPRNCEAEQSRFSLTGDLGIVEAVALGMSSIGPDDGAGFKKDKAFGQTIQFVVTRNVSGVGPTWSLVHFSGPGGLLGAERVDTHQLIVSFAPGEKKGGQAPASVRAREMNNNLLLRSLPAFRPALR